MHIYEARLRSILQSLTSRAYDEADNVIETHEQMLRRGYSITMDALNRTAKLRRGARLP